MSNARSFGKIAIRKFRGLENLELGDLGAFNLLLGANDTGKTSVLDAIFLLSAPSKVELIIRIQNYRNYIVRTFDDLSNIFHMLDTDDRMELSATGGYLRQERKLSISAPSIGALDQISNQRAKNDGVNQGGHVRGTPSSSPITPPRAVQYDAVLSSETSADETLFSCRLIVHRDGRMEIQPPVAPEEQAPIDQRMTVATRIIRPGTDYDAAAIGNLTVEKKDEELVNILKRVDPQIRGVTVHGDVAYLDVGMTRMIPINMFGGGIVRIADISAHCINGESDVMLIDEIENGIHHKGIRPMLESILSLSIDRGIQFFVSTHSIDVLKSLQNILSQEENKAYRPTTACFVLARDRHDKVKSYKYDYEQFDHCISNDIEIRR